MSTITYFSPIGFKSVCDVFFGNLSWGIGWNTNNIALYINNFLTQQYNDQLEIIKTPPKKILTILCNHQSEVFTFLAKHVLNTISSPFVIISFGGDETFPTETIGYCRDKEKNYYDMLVQSKYFKHWFAVNKIIPDDDRFTSIPYGLNYWTLTKEPWCGLRQCSLDSQDKTMLLIAKNALMYNERIPKIFINWHYNYSDNRHGDWRRKLQTVLPDNITYYAQNIERNAYWKKCSEYAFVVSPHGNGLDCIRTWEALCLGCIVIVKKSAIDNLYHDLPVVIVNEWTDINEQFLKNILISYSKRDFNKDKLTMNYWIEKLNYILKN